MVLKFIKKLTIYFLICLGIVTLVLETQGQYVDNFYVKFTTPKVNSIIMGDSRAFFGMTPHIINEELKSSSYALPIYNYCFTIDQAHIGPLYRQSVLRKITQKATNGLFLISLDPMMLSSNIKNSNENGEFVENGTPPHDIKFVDKKPNYEYLIKHLNYFEFKAMFKKDFKIHDDGWMEINNIPDNENQLKVWKSTQMENFHEMAKTYRPSSYRLKSLDTLVKTLKNHGDVYFLRMPIDADFLALETDYFEDFDEKVGGIAQKNDIQYFNFGTTDSTYFAYDGHHLDRKSAELFNKRLCDSILKYKK